MSITVTTPTGRIGSMTAEILLRRGEQVTVVARNPKKVTQLAKLGASIVHGSHADAEIMLRATRDAEALFLLSPPDLHAEDGRVQVRRFGLAAAKAVKDNSIPYVVNVSSIGVDLANGSGPVAGLRDNEEILNEAASNVVHLRPAYFMDNTIDQIPALKLTGKLYSPFLGQTPVPMIATRDIAAYAAELLIARDWQGRKIVELNGSEDESFNEIAEILTRILGMPVRHETLTPARTKAALQETGASKQLSDLLVELSESFSNGKVKFHRQAEYIAAPTSFSAFAKEVFRPAFKTTEI